jgi:hypothetical protein
VAGLATWLSRSNVVISSGGVYQAMLLPVGDRAIRWRADLSRVATAPRLEGMHGPVIVTAATDTVAHWYCRSAVERASVTHDALTIPCAGDTTTLSLYAESGLPSAVVPTASRMAVVSDLEGDVAYFRRWARTLGVLDSLDRWQFGDGHVVVLGDMLDRGRRVYDLLWLLYDVQHQARAAGGALHIVLGNHEQYGFRGIIKDVEAEHLYAVSQIMSYADALGPRTVLGRWLRAQPIMLRIGDALFVHGGISPTLLARGLSIDSVNALHRAWLDGAVRDDETIALLTGPAAPTQYRGYFLALDAEPLATREQVEATRRAYGARHIVVGHTETEELTPRFGGAVYGVNTSLTSDRVLTFDAGVPRVTSIGHRRTAFRDARASERRFSLVSRSDWAALVGVFGAMSPAR